MRMTVLIVAWHVRRWREKAAMQCAWMLPRWLVGLAFIRVVAHATTGQYGTTIVPELTAMEAIRRWDHA